MSSARAPLAGWLLHKVKTHGVLIMVSLRHHSSGNRRKKSVGVWCPRFRMLLEQAAYVISNGWRDGASTSSPAPERWVKYNGV
jgi:hypothetical protein